MTRDYTLTELKREAGFRKARYEEALNTRFCNRRTITKRFERWQLAQRLLDDYLAAQEEQVAS